MRSICASFLFTSAIILHAQTVEPVPSSLPTELKLPDPTAAPAEAQRSTLSGPQLIGKIRQGQLGDEVHYAIGQPTAQWQEKHGKQRYEEYAASDGRVLLGFRLRDGQYPLDTIRFDPLVPAQAGPSSSSVVDKVASVVDRFYLTYYCPKIYQRPLMWMTAAEYQLLQACNANGFMFFSMYFYTGGTR
jgi:hypothetical protein